MYVRELTFFFVGSRIHVQIWFVKRRLGVSRALQRGRATRFIFCNNTVWYKFSLNWYTSISHFSSQWVLISQALHTRYMITLKNLAYVLVYAYSQVEEYTATSKYEYIPGLHIFWHCFVFQHNSWEVLPSAILWTSSGHGGRPFSPPGPARSLRYELRIIRFSIPNSCRFPSNVAPK